MKAESIVFFVAGAFVGLLVGWILGTQTAGAPGVPAAVSAPAQAGAATAPAKTLDENAVQALRASAERDPKSVQPRVELGNLYFDAERYSEAVQWYADALKLDPRNADVSTDLGVSYYYLNQPDQALQQFDYSLKVSPGHRKTLLNQGVVRAFGKQDLAGAAESWQAVIDAAPDSEEGKAARKMLDGLRSAHPGIGGAAPAATQSPGTPGK